MPQMHNQKVARTAGFAIRVSSVAGAPPPPETALSRGERVARDGAFSSRRGSGEGSLHCCTHPPQNTENSGNELNDLLQAQDLARNVYTKLTVSEAQNEPVDGVHESDGPASPHPRTNPSPVVLRLEKTPEPDTLSPRERAVASHGEVGPRRRFLQPQRDG